MLRFSHLRPQRPQPRPAIRPVAVGAAAAEAEAGAEGQVPGWDVTGRFLGPFTDATVLELSRADMAQRSLPQQTGGLLLPSAALSIEPEAGQVESWLSVKGQVVCTLRELLEKQPDGLMTKDLNMVRQGLQDFCQQLKHGVRAASMTVDDWVVWKHPTSAARYLLFGACHKLILVPSGSVGVSVMPSEELVPDYQDHLAVICVNAAKPRKLGLQRCHNTAKDTMASMGQLLYIAMTGHSALGRTAQDKKDAHGKLGRGQALDVTSSHDAAADDLISFCLDPYEARRCGPEEFEGHAFFQQHNPMFAGKVMVTIGGLLQDNHSTQQQRDAQHVLKSVAGAAGRLLASDAVAREQLGEQACWLLDFKHPDSGAAGGFSRGDGCWDLGSLPQVMRASRNTDSHPGKLDAWRLTDLKARAVREAPSGDLMLQVVGRGILPRVLQGFPDLVATLGHNVPCLLPPSATGCLLLALQKQLHSRWTQLVPFHRALNPLVRVTAAAGAATWFENMEEGGAAVHWLDVMALPLEHPEEEEEEEEGVVGAAAAVAVDDALAVVAGPAAGGAVEGLGVEAQPLYLWTTRPLLSCRGVSFYLPRCLPSKGLQEALLPAVEHLPDVAAFLLGLTAAKAGLDYMLEQLTTWLLAATAQGYTGPLVATALCGCVNLLLLQGRHPDRDAQHVTELGLGRMFGLMDHLFPELSLPPGLQPAVGDTLVAHSLLFTGYSNSWAAAAALPVPEVGLGHAARVHVLCREMAAGRPIEALAAASHGVWVWRRYWLLPATVSSTRDSAAKLLGAADRSCRDIAGALQLLPADNLQEDDVECGPFVPSRARWPAAALRPKETAEQALAAADAFMAAAGYQPRPGPQGMSHKFKYRNDGLPHGTNGAARGKRVVALGGSSAYNRQPQPPKRGRRR